MATCKDCVHVEVCRFYINSLLEAGAEYMSEDLQQELAERLNGDACEHFKDRARFVELPCKVGDKVYCGSFGKIMEDEIKCIIIDADETRMILKRGISYDIDMINQMFFFTREEAEQALKERENNG